MPPSGTGCQLPTREPTVTLRRSWARARALARLDFGALRGARGPASSGRTLSAVRDRARGSRGGIAVSLSGDPHWSGADRGACHASRRSLVLQGARPGETARQPAGEAPDSLRRIPLRAGAITLTLDLAAARWGSLPARERASLGMRRGDHHQVTCGTSGSARRERRCVGTSGGGADAFSLRLIASIGMTTGTLFHYFRVNPGTQNRGRPPGGEGPLPSGGSRGRSRRAFSSVLARAWLTASRTRSGAGWQGGPARTCRFRLRSDP